jgi:hypothetical protein
MTAEEQFWIWFVGHEAELFEFDPEDERNRERLFDLLAVELQKVYPDLTFEFSPQGRTREFVISAAGIKGAFPAVVSLAKSAPTLERWRITAFRPRRSPLNIVQIGTKRIDPRDVQFTLLDNGKIAGIRLFIQGFQEGDVDLKQIGYLLLDEALGEYDVETRLGLIEMLPMSAGKDEDRHPLPDLPAMFDRLTSQLERRSGRPS